MKYFRLLAVLLALTLTVGSVPAFAADDAGTDAEYDGYIVKLRDDAVTTFSAASDAESLGFNMYLVEDEEEALALAGSGAVEFVEPNYRVELYGSSDITDGSYYDGTQWYLNGPNGMNITAAWDWSDETLTGGVTGTGVTVAVLDTGLYSSHADFKNTNILSGYNAADNSGTYADSDWHGTAVTGVIAAGVNNFGIVGAAYGVSVLPIRVFNSQNISYVSYVVQGIRYAIYKKADVINISLGLEENDQSFAYAVQAALDAGIIVVAAAGNDGENPQKYDDLCYPTAYDGVIGVGAIGSNGTVASYSQKNESVWVSAPGTDIFTTYALNNTSTQAAYIKTSGTSFSSPCVAALAALAKQYAKAHSQTLTPAEFANLLRLTAADAGSTGYDTSYGWGTVHADRMLAGMVKQSVTYELNGGAWPEDVPATAYVPYDDDEVLLTSSVPVMEGYSFGGWYESEDCSGTSVTSFVPADSSGAHIYYAKWISNAAETSGTSAGASSGMSAGASGGGSGNTGQADGDEDAGVSAQEEEAEEDGEADSSSEPILFEDVSEDAWYYDAVQWAVRQRITSGTGTATFSPNGSCTRAQAVTFLWRLAGSPDVGGSNLFSDVSSSSYYYKAVLWAAQNGITSGTSAGTFSPDSVCERGQIAAFLYRYAGRPSVTGESSFSDVSPDSYYFSAVQWAVQNRVTAGTGDGKFSPESTCIRAQIVAFLYRYVTG